jgi:hypothetical protein
MYTQIHYEHFYFVTNFKHRCGANVLMLLIENLRVCMSASGYYAYEWATEFHNL